MKKLIVLGVLMGLVTALAFADDKDGIFSFQVGQFEVYLLVESEREGNASILVGVDEAILRRYVPPQGFKHTANAILIKAPRQNILIDTGTGAGGVIVDKIKKLGVEPDKVNAVLLTHLHGDHFGSLQKDGKATFPKAKIYLSAKELEYFTKTNVNQNAVNALAPYKSNVVTFEPGILNAERRQQLLPGIFPIAAYGHTPGHTIFLLESGRAKMLVIGDLLHVAVVQFHLPSVSASYDIDGAAAAATRSQVLTYAANNRLPIAGMHIVYPGMGFVETYGQEGFNFIPME